MVNITLDNFRLLVHDFAASFHFWHEIMGLKVLYQDENSTYAYLEAGSTRLELLKADYFARSFGASAPEVSEQRGVIAFRAENADVAFADLVERGAKPLAEPQNHPAGFARTALLSAPDGYIVEVFSSLNPMPKATE